MDSAIALSSSISFTSLASSFSGPTISRIHIRPRLPSSSTMKPLSASENAPNAELTKPKEAKLWGGRFEDSVTDAVERFTESISYDKQLYKYDIMGSKAHATMLAHQVIFMLFFFGNFTFWGIMSLPLLVFSLENGKVVIFMTIYDQCFC